VARRRQTATDPSPDGNGPAVNPPAGAAVSPSLPKALVGGQPGKLSRIEAQPDARPGYNPRPTTQTHRTLFNVGKRCLRIWFT
jgi:hypothetical protein